MVEVYPWLPDVFVLIFKGRLQYLSISAITGTSETLSSGQTSNSCEQQRSPIKHSGTLMERTIPRLDGEGTERCVRELLGRLPTMRIDLHELD